LLLSVRDFTWGHGDCQAMLFMSMRDGVFPSKHSPHRTNGLLRKVRSNDIRVSLDLSLLRHYNLCLH
jgi:hypothetical protein